MLVACLLDDWNAAGMEADSPSRLTGHILSSFMRAGGVPSDVDADRSKRSQVALVVSVHQSRDSAGWGNTLKIQKNLLVNLTSKL